MITNPITNERLAHELGRLGVPFVRSQASDRPPVPIQPADFLAGLAASDEARLRLALIPLLLIHAEYAVHAPDVAAQLESPPRLCFICYYTAALLLQRLHADRLQTLVGPQPPLPDHFSHDLGLPTASQPHQRLQLLAARHAALSGYPINWLGTYQHGAERLFKHLEKARLWTD
jgi:hypothetical protein